jgi:chemotaxis protein methyltransferase CheR
MSSTKSSILAEIFYKIYMEQKISFEDFVFIRDYIHKISGIYLDYEKEYLIRQRIEPILKDININNFNDFSKLIKDGRSMRFKESIISAITTNETSFFRDDHPFRSFYSFILPKLIEKIRTNKMNKTRQAAKIRIWSAACSSGQEPYSIAMLIDEYLNNNPSVTINKNDFYILATDIDAPVLKVAVAGVYDQMAVSRGLSEERLKKYFIAKGNKWEIKDEIKQMVDFQKCSLHEGISPVRFGGTFDVILARNVLIYFDVKTKDDILSRINQLMQDDSTLILGATENLYGMSDKFESFSIQNTLLFKKITLKIKPR